MNSSNKLLELLTNFTPLNNYEASLQKRYIDFVKNTPTAFDRTHLAGHVTGSAWLMDTSLSRVLMTHHKKLGKWLQLGGHSDGNSDTLEVSLREAREESGFQNIIALSKNIMGLDIHEIPARGHEPTHFHYDATFTLQVVGNEKFIVSEESHDLAWVKIEDILNGDYEDSLKRLAQHWMLMK